MRTCFIKCMFYTLIVVSISGCGARIFNTRGSNPVLEDYVGTWPAREVGTLTTDAAHRTTVIRMNDAKPNNPDGAWQRGEFCAEPPPDAMVNIAAAFGAAIKVSAKEPQTMTDITGQIEFFNTLATIMNPLLRRSQGLQWNRDNLSFICNAYLNRTITKDQYLTLVQQIIARSSEIIEKELDKLPKLDVTYTGTSVAPVVPTFTLSGNGADKPAADKAAADKAAADKAAAAKAAADKAAADKAAAAKAAASDSKETATDGMKK